MATTKIRKKTPMKNRPCLWRKIAKKQEDGTRTGRALRNAIVSTISNKKFLLPIHVWLFKSAGIPTPEFDNRFNMVNNELSTTNNQTIEGEANVVV